MPDQWSRHRPPESTGAIGMIQSCKGSVAPSSEVRHPSPRVTTKPAKMRRKESTAKIGRDSCNSTARLELGSREQSRHQIKTGTIEKPGHLAGLIESINWTNAETTKLKYCSVALVRARQRNPPAMTNQAQTRCAVCSKLLTWDRLSRTGHDLNSIRPRKTRMRVLCG
jgi:hypothetical protein